MRALERLCERFWFAPALMCLGASVLAEARVAVDRALGDLPVTGRMSELVYQLGLSGSQDILGAIASSSLAVAATTFTITRPCSQ